MDPIPATSSENNSELKQVRMLAHASAISILILTGTIFIFFYRQVSSVRKNTNELVKYIVDYEKSEAPEFIKEVHRKFADFSKEHPDFTPIYKRYFGTNAPPPVTAQTNAVSPRVTPGPKSD